MSNIISLQKYRPAWYDESRCQVLCTVCESRSWRLVSNSEEDTEFKVECFNCGNMTSNFIAKELDDPKDVATED